MFLQTNLKLKFAAYNNVSHDLSIVKSKPTNTHNNKVRWLLDIAYHFMASQEGSYLSSFKSGNTKAR